MFCHFYGRYHLPTLETVAYLKELIDGRNAIEIGSGCGDLGAALGIKMTDSWLQNNPDIKKKYENMGQPTLKYGNNVEKLEALEAVEKYNPEVVIASWVTQFSLGAAYRKGIASPYGVKETEIIKKTDYILIGSEKIHSQKMIMQFPHEKITSKAILSRRPDNHIWIWKHGETES